MRGRWGRDGCRRGEGERGTQGRAGWQERALGLPCEGAGGGQVRKKGWREGSREQGQAGRTGHPCAQLPHVQAGERRGKRSARQCRGSTAVR